MNKVRVGIIGTGFTIGIAMSHVDSYRKIPDAELVAVYDKVPGRAAAFLEKHKVEGVKACETLEEFFSMVDAVSVCTPNFEHVNTAIAAMEAGKHVIVEKPFSLNYEDGLRAREAARKHPELVNMTCFNYREQREIQMMKRIIDSGKLGKIISVRHIGGGFRMWDGENVYLEWRMQEATSGTGAMADFGVHMLDLTDYLLHDEIGDFTTFAGMTTTLVKERYVIDPEDVMGGKKGSEKAPVTNDDVATFCSVSESGALVTFQTGRLVGGITIFEIAGEQGTLLRSSTYPEGKLGLYIRSESAGFFPKLELVDIDEDLTGTFGHHEVLAEFIDCIVNGRQSDRDFTRGLYIQRLVDNYGKAAKTGQTICETVSEKNI